MSIVRKAKDRIRALERENSQLKRDLEQANATMEYVAMMADVDLEEGEEDDAQ